MNSDKSVLMLRDDVPEIGTWKPALKPEINRKWLYNADSKDETLRRIERLMLLQKLMRKQPGCDDRACGSLQQSIER